MENSRKDIVIGHSVVLLANVIFALNAPFSKTLLSSVMDGYALALWRMGGAAVLFWIASLFVKSEKIERGDWLMLLGASLFGVIFNQGLFIIGLEKTTPLDAVLLKALTPIMTMLIAAVYLKNRINLKKGIGVLLGCGGAVFLILSENGFQVSFSGNTVGNLIVFVSAFAYAMYFAVFIKVVKKYSPVTVMKWMFLFATLVCAPFWGDNFLACNYSAFTGLTVITLGFVVVCATFLTYFLLPIGQKRLMPTVVSMYIYSQPIVVAVSSVMMGMDKFSWDRALATVLIFLGVYLVTTHQKELGKNSK